MENKVSLDNDALGEVTGGAQETIPTTHGNICPRCRSARHHMVRMEGKLELRECDQCHLEYFYRKW